MLIDVVMVRPAIAPAVVTLPGDHAWWLPRSLECHSVKGLDEKLAGERVPAPA